ncbi:MAG: DEAD/DEAH box helicase [Clostridia bacterium]|nr:DEAD/DEAH box helicase [Clostridia bacterium]
MKTINVNSILTIPIAQKQNDNHFKTKSVSGIIEGNRHHELYKFIATLNFINHHELINDKSIADIINAVELDNFKYKDIIETFQQNQKRLAINKNDWNEVSFIAPTSFGKSSIIIDLIKINKAENVKHAIILPTKSLLLQTFRNIRNEKLNEKILIHDEMFEDNKSFIGIFTQERALRLLESVDWGYDFLYIDEAHNLLNDNSRSILLTRLIKLNKIKNPNCRIIYLSPLVSDSDNLKIFQNQNIKEYKISQNIKLPEYYLYDEKCYINKYNKYFNSHYPIGFEKSYLNYIVSKSSDKNLIYFNRPKKIEDFVEQFVAKVPKIRLSKELKDSLKILSKYVHKDFNMIDYLSKGVMYLHGKIPDYIKDYLEYKFKTIEQIRFLVANSVLLEGVNLPITSLFILDSYSLTYKRLTNLIGRVNRLSEIFSDNGSLKLLFPQIHFVHSNYNNNNMNNYLERLRDTSVLDEINNPLLSNYLDSNNEAKQKTAQKIKSNEKIYFSEPSSDLDRLHQKLISLGMDEIYKITQPLLTELSSKILEAKSKYEGNPVTRISKVFINENYDVIDYEIRRLKEESAQKYYINFIKYSKVNSLKRNIIGEIKNFKNKIQNEDYFTYIGNSYGEVKRNGEVSENYKENVYLSLKDKTDSQLVNIAIVKLKMEEDFISFKYSKFVELALETDVITEEEYDMLLYGTSVADEIKLMKQGFSPNLLTKLKKENQIGNIYFNENNMACGNEDFKNYFAAQDDFNKFQIDKFILV